MSKVRFALTLSLAAFSTNLYAKDLFENIGITTDEKDQIQIQAGDSSFPDLIEKVIEAKDQFQQLENRDSINYINYGGVKEAMSFKINAVGSAATLEIPVLDFKREFTGTSRDNLYDNIEDFLKKEGSDVYRRFLEAMNKKSLVAVSDGNPNSATAAIANSIFDDSGFGGNDSVTQALNISNMNLSLMAGMASIKAGDFEGRSYELPLGFSFGITDQITAKISAPLRYRVVEDAAIYDGNMIVNVPIKLLTPTINSESHSDGSPWFWMVTPSVGVGVTGSADYAAGSFLYMFGLTNVLGYNFGTFSVTMGNSISVFNSSSYDVDDYDVGGDVDQQILKNGLKWTMPLDQKWVVEAYGIYTQFLQDAALENYYTLGVQAGMRLGKETTDESGVLFFRIGSDIGDDYSSVKVTLGSGFRF